MSGPKVVNIEAVRRRQRRQCRTVLRELAEVVDECLRMHQGDATATNDFKRNTETVVDRLNHLRETEQWPELLAQTSAHRDFYRSEAESLRQRHVERRTLELRREHRLRQGAAQLQAELSRLPASSARDEALEAISTASDAECLQKACARAESTIIEHRTVRSDENVSRLRRLADEYQDPLGDTPPVRQEVERDPDEVRLERCWRLIGELSVLPDCPTSSWTEKVQQVAMTTPSERALALDSLALELTSYLKLRRRQRTAIAAVKAVLASLDQLPGPDSESWRKKLTSALSPRVSTEEALALASSAQTWVDAAIAREDARVRRDAVLRALADLGYEVREGMVAAWTEQGRVVVHKPNDSVYGVELSAPPTGPAVQLRVVAIGAESRSKQRDYEIEQSWCAEFARLQAMLDSDGFTSEITTANAPGVVPIKEIKGMAPSTAGRHEAGRQRFSKHSGV